ncbi:MAG TPA: TetR/AcrR family transcriptional regulator [Stenotrophomonas sp.]|nr:TetR/AcrR family transcriptional regulator [Stenotrophomonas sp.]
MPSFANSDASSASEHARQQRQRILDAARACFIEDGFEAASMSKIAARAGLSTGLPYHYFENKRAIVLALIEQQLEQSRQGLAQIQAADDLGGALQAAFDVWRSGEVSAFHVGLQSEIIALGMRDADVGRDLQRNARQMRERLAEWLQQRDAEQGRGRTPDELALAAAVLQCFADGLALMAARDPAFDPALLAALLKRVLPLALEG